MSDTAADFLGLPAGGRLRLRHWPLPEGACGRGHVLIVHGLGEHAGRYAHVAARLNQWGFAVDGYDHEGHGESSGARGRLSTPGRLREDLATMVERCRAGMRDAWPLILLGHSMGGLVAADFVARGVRPIDGLVLSSPALASGMSPLQRATAALLARLAPHFAIGNGLKPEFISHDPAEVAAYRDDPLGHDRVSARLAHFIDVNGAPTVAAAPRWRVPTLLLFAGDDYLVDAEGSRRFAAAAPPRMVTAREFPGLYHELFNERDREPVFVALRAWLDARFPGRGR
ncbi:alpha/beta hydrolase [Lysobacter pythonis]|uniref:Alpha/beta hydrolase n=1 Tax=Solilutibacter pythonis TaxID=2483112 RepID=A0A3M2HU10_9GAMM|nr:alpha/beta hydrolase [Lysobacter pythonis]RMH93226.1 alpha/beta hydrolase [Lysobacter pythonis]